MDHTLLSNASYNGAGAPTGFNYGNGVAASFGYNSRMQLASLRYSNGGSDLFYLTYDYNATHEQPDGTNATGNNGQIGRINDLVDTGRSTTYTYDYRGRLKTGQSDGFSPEGIYNQWGLAWEYDRFGNRTSQNVTLGSGPSSQLSFDPNNNRITSAGYGYDASGNLTQDPMGSSVYDGESRLTSPASSPFPVTYTFDAHNQRVKKFAWNTTTEYVYSKALGNKLLAVYINGGVSREYVYVGGTLIATRLSNGTIQYHHSDHLSVRVTSDGSGSVIGYQGHYPFGESWYSNNAPFYNYRFTSYGWDSNVSQLYYAVNRFYNYQIGRFQTPDLLDLTTTCTGPGVGHRLLNPGPRDANLYPYVNNDPTNRVDPLGLFPPECSIWPPITPPTFPIPIPGNEPIPTFCPLDPFEGAGARGTIPFPISIFVQTDVCEAFFSHSIPIFTPKDPDDRPCTYDIGPSRLTGERCKLDDIVFGFGPSTYTWDLGEINDDLGRRGDARFTACPKRLTFHFIYALIPVKLRPPIRLPFFTIRVLDASN